MRPTRVLAGVALAGACMILASQASAQTGTITAFGGAVDYGAPPAAQLNAPVSAMAGTPDGAGYWLLGADGGVFAYGDAGFYGSEGGAGIFSPFVGIAPSPDGRGYWITGAFGNVDNFGDAPGEASLTRSLAAPVVGIAANPKAVGYWLAGADGGVFSFGDTHFYGGLGGVRLAKPVVGIAATPDGGGYWLVAADGGVFSFGDAHFFGGLGGAHLAKPVVGIAATPDGAGYWLVAADGGVFSFGDAHFFGSLGATPANSRTPVVAIAATRGGGYWLATTDKELPPPTRVPSVLAQCNEPGTAPSVEPGTIILACGDGNALLQNLAWTSWTPTTATATGEFTHNTCTPDCADGTFVSAPATVRLDYPIQTGAGSEFATISYTYADPSAPGGSFTFTGVAPTSAG